MFINELKYNYNDFSQVDVGDAILVFKGNVFPLFLNDDAENKTDRLFSIAQMICKDFTGFYNRFFDEDGNPKDELKNDFSLLVDTLYNCCHQPKILWGDIIDDNGAFAIDFVNSFNYDIVNSKEFSDFMKTPVAKKFDEVIVNGDVYNGEKTSLHQSALKNNVRLANKLYHGTCLNFLDGIFKKGLRSNEDNSIFDIHNNGFVFLSSVYDTALYYAKDYAEDRKSIPVVVVIDSSKINQNNIVLDYDIGRQYASDRENNPFGKEYKSKKIGNITNFSKENGSQYAKLGYKGIIMPNAIDGAYIIDKGNKVYYTKEEYMNDLNRYRTKTTEGVQHLSEMSSSDINLNSFKIKEDLNPDFWVDGKLNSRVRIRLLDIADDFIDELSVSWVKPEDIVFTGSMANYNWSKYSDIDIHILMDYNKIYKEKKFVEDYFKCKKELWSETHKSLRIYGYPVEIYVEDSSSKNNSTGVYSLTKNRWLEEPGDFEDSQLNERYIKEHAAKIMTDIDNTISKMKSEKDAKKIEKCSDKLQSIFDKLNKQRKESLKKSGEMGSGNIIWKICRRMGYLDKIWECVNFSYDVVNSIK